MGNKERGGDKAVNWVAWLLMIVFLIVGGIAYFIGFTDHPAGSVCQTIWLTAGNVLIVGGIIGFITNVLQSFDFFRKQLRKELFSDDYLRKRKDVDNVWEIASKEIFKQKFPGIQREFLTALKNYLPCDDVTYYDDYETHIDVKWAGDPKDGKIKVTSKIIFKLIPESEKKFTYNYTTWTTFKDSESEVTYRMESVKVNDKNMYFGHTHFAKDNQRCDKCSMELSGSRIYRFEMVETKIYDVNTDYVIGFRAKHITHDLRVQLLHPADIWCEFVPMGTQNGFQDVNKSETMHEMRYEGVIFPKQGYIFALYPQKL